MVSFPKGLDLIRQALLRCKKFLSLTNREKPDVPWRLSSVGALAADSRINKGTRRRERGGPQFSQARTVRLNSVKEESERDPVQEASDRQRRERLLEADKDSGSEARQQGSAVDQKQREKRRLVGHVVRSAPWI